MDKPTKFVTINYNSASFQDAVLLVKKFRGLHTLFIVNLDEELSEKNFFPPPGLKQVMCKGTMNNNRATINLSEELCSRLEELEKITLLNFNSLKLTENLKMLKNLKNAKFINLKNIEGLENIAKMGQLTILILIRCGFENLYLSQVSNLEFLKLFKSSFPQSTMNQMIGDLPVLKRLREIMDN